MAAPDPSATRVLIADDDEFVRGHLELTLKGAGHGVVSVVDGARAIEAIGDGFSCAILDLDMPGASGLEVLGVAKSKVPDLPVIMLSGAGEVADAVAALKRGAFDYLSKPFDPEELLARVREAMRLSRLQAENSDLKSAYTATAEPITLVGEAGASKNLMDRARRCAGVDSTVLITGPSGTGKSVLARWIHQNGPRAKAPFVTVNCAALPRELIESELFGHEKGAFTGAVASKPGKFESADGGTLFLDEIGEMPLDLQPKLLSAIQDRTVTRVGGAKEKQVDVRLIAATNQDLPERISERAFREDLYYRLNVLTLESPALRARPEDIIPIAIRTLERLAVRVGRPPAELDESARASLLGHTWPGNVRELENVLERAMVFAGESGRVSASDLGTLVGPAASIRDSDLVGMTIAELERRAVLATLAAFGGNRGAAAESLGVSERTIYNRLKEYGRETEGDPSE